jgi:nitroreductase
MSFKVSQPTHAPLSAAEAIIKRRATRHFDPNAPLSEDTLKTILHLGTMAPSSNNLQPWRFIVVRTPQNREKLRQCSFGQPKIGEAAVVVIVLGYHKPHTTHLEPMVDKQIELGAVTPDVGAGIKATAFKSQERVVDRELWATKSAMLAAANIMIAAESLGVASAPMEGFESEKVRQAFGIPDDHAVCCLIALGYALSAKPYPGRFPLEAVCYEEHFGQPWTLGEARED